MKREIRGFLNHEEDSVEYVYNKYFPLLKHIAFNIVQDMTEAEDIAHETFVRALRHSHSFKEGGKFLPWLTTICKNLAINRKKERDRLVPLDEEKLAEMESTDQSPVDYADKAVSNVIVAHALEWLYPLEYKIFMLRAVYQLTYKEIKQILGLTCPVGTIVTKYNRAVKYLKKFLEEYQNEYQENRKEIL